MLPSAPEAAWIGLGWTGATAAWQFWGPRVLGGNTAHSQRAPLPSTDPLLQFQPSGPQTTLTRPSPSRKPFLIDPQGNLLRSHCKLLQLPAGGLQALPLLQSGLGEWGDGYQCGAPSCEWPRLPRREAHARARQGLGCHHTGLLSPAGPGVGRGSVGNPSTSHSYPTWISSPETPSFPQ